MYHPRKPGGAALLGLLSQPPVKNDPWPICSKFTGDLSHGEGNLP